MNNIEKMEDLKSKYCNDTMNGNIWIAYFMECVIEEFKDILGRKKIIHENKITQEINDYIDEIFKGIKDIVIKAYCRNLPIDTIIGNINSYKNYLKYEANGHPGVSESFESEGVDDININVGGTDPD